MSLYLNSSNLIFADNVAVFKVHGDIVRFKIESTIQHPHAKDHHGNVRCPYDPRCPFNDYPIRTISTLGLHIWKNHSAELKKLTKPMPCIMTGWGEELNVMYIQCGGCGRYFALGHERHYRERCITKKNGCRWIGLNEILHSIKKHSLDFIDGESYFEEVFGKGAFDILKNRVQNCVYVDRNVKKWLDWKIRSTEPGPGVERYYILHSVQLKLIYVGSTEQFILDRFTGHSNEVLEIFKASDMKISVFGTIPIHLIQENYHTIKAHVEYVVVNSFNGVNGYKFVNNVVPEFFQ